MAGAALSAAGQVGGAIAGGKAAKKVARIQQQTTEEIMAQAKQYYQDAENRYQPEVTSGDQDNALYQGAIGNGDSAAATAALKAFQNSTGYQATLDNALAGTNASAYSSGLGKSGAAMLALQKSAGNVAQGSYNTWLGDVNTGVQTGMNAKNAITGAATTGLQTSTQAQQTGANNQSSAAMAQGGATASALQNLGNIASNAYTSSYGDSGLGGVLSGVRQFGGSSPIAVYNNPDYSEG